MEKGLTIVVLTLFQFINIPQLYNHWSLFGMQFLL